jgi:glycine oxidase
MNRRMSVPSTYSDPGGALDVVVVGAGIIGLAIALELHDRGAGVTVIERGHSLTGASIAAAGMLAVEDPSNPAQLRPFSQLSAEQYPAFLRRIEELSGIAVPFQTETTIQYLADGTKIQLVEQSLDPRQLAGALLAAVKETSIRVLEETRIAAIGEMLQGLRVRLTSGDEIASRTVVYAAGAWTAEAMEGVAGGVAPVAPIVPRKGQMLRVRLPSTLPLREVHRSERIYIVPRTRGAQAGTALIGATIEDAGFDTTLHAEDLAALRACAAALVPELGSEMEAPLVEAWAGLRPATADFLPMLGACGGAGRFIASGHYRNGILQAPGTALVIADLVEGKTPAINLSAFSPDRFSAR